MRINLARLEHEAEKKSGRFSPPITANDTNVPRRAHAKTTTLARKVSEVWSEGEWMRRADRWERGLLEDGVRFRGLFEVLVDGPGRRRVRIG